MLDEQNISAGEQLKKLIEENLAYTKEIKQITKKIKRHLLINQIFSFIYLIIIIVPIILAVIYLPSLLQNSLNSFLPTDLQGVSIDELLKDKNLLQTLLDLQKK